MSLEPKYDTPPTSMACALIDRLPDSVFCLTGKGAISPANEAARKVFGTPLDCEELTVDRYFPVHTAERLMEAFRNASEASECTAFPGMMMMSSQDLRPVEFRPLGMHDDAHGRVSLAILMRDLGNPGALHAAEALGQRPGIGELCALLAHDVSNPLSVIKLYLEWIAADICGEDAGGGGADMDMLAESLRNIQESSGRIENLVSRLRDFSRAVEPPARLTDLKDSVRDALLIVSGRLASERIEVVFDVPDDDCPICANADQLRHAFLFIFNNACDALADSDSRNIHVQLSRISDSSLSDALTYACSITDSGPGMTPEVLERVFEAFATTRKGAAGLGMPIMRNIMRRHGGDVRVSSQPGHGTTIQITLPALLEQCGKTSEVIDEP